MRARRRSLEMTLKDVATATGSTAQTIQRIETGGMSITTEWIEKISRALRVAPATFFSGDARLRPLEEWHEGIGDVLWWRFPVSEPPYVGSPLDLGHTVESVTRYIEKCEVVEKVERHQVGGWPGYHTHFTEIQFPAEMDTAEA